MEYHDSPAAEELAARAREFVDEVVIPTENRGIPYDPFGAQHCKSPGGVDPVSLDIYVRAAHVLLQC